MRYKILNQEEPEEFWQGVEQFNQGQFYACHDTLEALWMEATEPEKTFYQGVLQVAVGLYHLGNNNWHGAVILLGEGVKRLDRYPSAYSGIDVDELIISSADLLKTLQQAGAEKVGTWQLGKDAIATETSTLPLPKIVPAESEIL
ncbi:MAG: hypothetical protein N4J56_005980 [Chroococcidiopsis sp. SAG 2025]|nr:hypothetical protein [Chroococcidiopsis sp. SAG 2025]